MSETTLAHPKIEPKTIYLKDYQAPNYFVDEIDLHFDLYDEHTLVKSRLRIRHNRHSQNQSRDLILNGEELQLVSIKLEQKTLADAAYTVDSQQLTIHDAPDNFELEIITKIFPHQNAALMGLYCSGKAYCTQCEAEGFRRITYYLDHPDVLSQFVTTMTADKKRYPYLLSNGNLIASGHLENNRHWVRWEDPFKKPSYLFALVAGDFDLIEDKFQTQSGRDIALQIYVEKGLGEQAQHAMYSVKEAMRWDEVAYGREYDLDIYMIVAINDFNMGAMENKGLNIFNTKYVLAKPETATDDDYINIMSVIGHEYFHNWSGNRVTCRDWFQLSLKEGLTIFRDQSFSEDLLSRAVMRIRDVIDLRETQFPEDAGPLAHPVRPDSYIEINNFYTATVYNKGAEVLRMLQTILGKTMFRHGMDLYFAKYDGQAATIEDFVLTMEDVSGIDLTQFRRWYSQAGTPVVKARDQYDATTKTYTLTFTQMTLPTPGQANKLPLHIPIVVGLIDQNGKVISLQKDEEVENEKILHLTEVQQSFQFDHIEEKPIPSLLRHFSAPIKMQYDYKDNNLLFLSKHDTDLFNRWESNQTYLVRVILRLIADYQKGKTLILPTELIEVYSHQLQQQTRDEFFLAEMLSVPSEKYLGEQMVIVDVEAIHTVREFLLTELAKQLETIFLKTYHDQQNESVIYKFSADEIGRRQLKNRALWFLSLLSQHIPLVVEQFEKSLQHNMTDTQAALSMLAQSDSAMRHTAFEKFYTVWKDDALVLNKWFSIQAMSKQLNTLQQVKQLLAHPAFDIKNPNNVYALIGGFAHHNPINFHQRSGEGYVFLREVVLRLDKFNPSVAARMVKPLTNWRRYDKERQTKMREQLDTILKEDKLSPDLYELATKSL
ncbi:MAG: hypothetical protein ACD_46C00358G0002 [uncultured bacterium]|nr:MAG: hypothetical protein ACD_46C00358G0002 [uncultured bacterium]